ncbi:hypothetical protein BC941DRAFT_477382 [Chlamydoabsidia padenii]|nr:hypothetical protein BC941DRAFT_477382 [Chlamydoabsidia padenii]
MVDAESENVDARSDFYPIKDLLSRFRKDYGDDWATDSISDIDKKALYSEHRKHTNAASRMMLIPVEKVLDFTRMEIDVDEPSTTAPEFSTIEVEIVLASDGLELDDQNEPVDVIQNDNMVPENLLSELRYNNMMNTLSLRNSSFSGTHDCQLGFHDYTY